MDGPTVDDPPTVGGVWSLPVVRVTAVVGVAALLVAVAAGVWAATWTGKQQAEALPETPVTEPAPSTPAPTTPRPTPPEAEAPPAPDTVAPAIPVVQAPADAILTRDPFPVFSGLGEPGAQLHLQLVDPADGRGRTVAATIVADDRTWSLAPAVALPDGRHSLLILQVDAAGNVSDAARRSITVDTVALPPVIAALPTGPLTVLPVIEGTGEPLALVTLRDERGAVLGTADVAADGRWRFALPDPGRDGMTVAATQTDGATVVEFTVSGPAGAVVEIAVDGVATGQRITLGTSPSTVSTAPLADGAHTIAVRFVEGSRVGVWTVITATVTAAMPTPTPTPTDGPAPSSSPSPSVEPGDAPAEEPADR